MRLGIDIIACIVGRHEQRDRVQGGQRGREAERGDKRERLAQMQYQSTSIETLKRWRNEHKLRKRKEMERERQDKI